MSEVRIYQPDIDDAGMAELQARLIQPFPIEAHDFKPQAISDRTDRALGAVYVDSRYYQDRLDEVDPTWTNAIEINLTGEAIIIVSTVTVLGRARMSTGECSLKDSNAATSAEAQAFKRACAAHGLGRYMYHLPKQWVDYDKQHKRFTHNGIEMLRVQLAQATGQEYTPRIQQGGNGNGHGNGHTPAPQKHQAPARKTATPAPATSNVGPTEFWSAARPLIGDKFPNQDAVKDLVARYTQGDQTNWAQAIQALN